MNLSQFLRPRPAPVSYCILNHSSSYNYYTHKLSRISGYKKNLFTFSCKIIKRDPNDHTSRSVLKSLWSLLCIFAASLAFQLQIATKVNILHWKAASAGESNYFSVAAKVGFAFWCVVFCLYNSHIIDYYLLLPPSHNVCSACKTRM